MRKVLIFGDSTCDLPSEWRDRLNVGFMPLPVNVGDEARLDMENVFQDEIFEYYRRTGTLCTTSAPNTMDYIAFWKKQREQEPDCNILHFHISSEMTSTFSASYAASREFENIWSVDTRSVSIGVAMLILEACRLRDEGKSGAEIFAEIEKMKERVRVAFVLDTVEFLYKGGRCTALQALGANVLGLHPAINMLGGKLVPGKRYRGGSQRVYHALIEDQLLGRAIETERIFIANTSFDAETNNIVEREIRAVRPDIQQLIFSRPGCSICVHCGPKTVGIAYMEKRPEA